MKIEEFCGTSRKYDTDKPFKIDGRIYATNLSIMIRLDGEMECQLNEKRIPLRSNEVFVDAKNKSASRELKVLDAALLKYKPIHCDCRWTSVCKHCGQELKNGPHVNDKKCVFCHGKGEWQKPQDLRLDNELIWNGKYIAMIIRNCINPKYKHSGQRYDPMYFTFDGGEGVLMPRIKADEY